MATPMILKIGSTNIVELSQHKDAVTQLPLADSVVTFDLLDSAGSAVTGATGISMAYAAGPPPAYRGAIAHTVALVAGAPYTIRQTATNSGNVRKFYLDCVAEA
jgi:hypothetical protein